MLLRKKRPQASTSAPQSDPAPHAHGKKTLAVSIRRSIYLGLCFMVLFSSVYAVQNSLTLVFADLQYGDLGNVALLTMYSAYAVASFFSTILLRYCSVRTSFFACALTFNAFTAVGYLIEHCRDQEHHFFCETGFVYGIIVTTSAIAGVASSVIWISGAVYIDDLTDGFERWRSGQFVGLFYAAYQMCQIGSSVLALVLYDVNQLTAFLVLLALGAVANVMFFCVPKSSGADANEEIHIDPNMRKMLDLMRQPEIKPLYGLIAFTSAIVVFYENFVYQIVLEGIPDDQESDARLVNTRTQIVLIVFGVSEVLCGVAISFIVEYVSLHRMIFVGTVVALVSLSISFIGMSAHMFGVSCMIAVFWGFAESYFNILIQTICVQDYNHKIEIFAIFRLVYGLSTGVGQVIVTVTQRYDIMLGVLMVAGVIAFIASMFLKKPKEDAEGNGGAPASNALPGDDVADDAAGFAAQQAAGVHQYAATHK